jgi:hypothetical protein
MGSDRIRGTHAACAQYEHDAATVVVAGAVDSHRPAASSVSTAHTGWEGGGGGSVRF